MTPATYYPARPASPRPQAAAPAQPAALKGAPDWPKEYSYVMKDLRRVGILAGCLLAALLVLIHIVIR